VGTLSGSVSRKADPKSHSLTCDENVCRRRGEVRVEVGN
jgi:hypothetical protein